MSQYRIFVLYEQTLYNNILVHISFIVVDIYNNDATTRVSVDDTGLGSQIIWYAKNYYAFCFQPISTNKSTTKKLKYKAKQALPHQLLLLAREC